MAAALEHPVGQPPLRELAAGKRRPVIVVDDLARPTPADLVLPLLLKHLSDAGIAAEDVTIVVGGGTHARAGREQLLKKVGTAGQRCTVLAHDCSRDLVKRGRSRIPAQPFSACNGWVGS